MTKTWIVVGIVAVLGIAALACDDDESPSVEEADQQLCSDLSVLDSALAALGTTISDSNSTVEQVQNDGDAVNDALDRVISSAEDVGSARTDEIDSAYSVLDQTVQDIRSGDETLVESLATVRSAAQAVIDAEAQLFSDLGC